VAVTDCSRGRPHAMVSSLCRAKAKDVVLATDPSDSTPDIPSTIATVSGNDDRLANLES
jgi:hypothetical protein